MKTKNILLILLLVAGFLLAISESSTIFSNIVGLCLFAYSGDRLGVFDEVYKYEK